MILFGAHVRRCLPRNAERVSGRQIQPRDVSLSPLEQIEVVVVNRTHRDSCINFVAISTIGQDLDKKKLIIIVD